MEQNLSIAAMAVLCQAATGMTLKDIESAAQKVLIERLNRLTDANRLLFMRMYSHDNLDKPICDVVGTLGLQRLALALTQAERTIELNNGLD